MNDQPASSSQAKPDVDTSPLGLAWIAIKAAATTFVCGWLGFKLGSVTSATVQDTQRLGQRVGMWTGSIGGLALSLYASFNPPGKYDRNEGRQPEDIARQNVRDAQYKGRIDAAHQQEQRR
jgi:hypothetical protein